MSKTKLRIAITGTTGLIGRNLLFEVIKQNLHNLGDLEILVLGRSSGSLSIKQRILSIIQDDGLEYISSIKEVRDLVIQYCDDRIVGIDIDLEKEGLALSPEGLKILRRSPINVVFHNAALTDLRSTPGITEALKRANIFGTRQLLKLLSDINNVGEFCYVGTSYSCGNGGGAIRPDFVDIKHEFRNSYEATKLESEVQVRNFARNTKTRCRYFRPSVTCGRLIEQPLGAVCKFDVFYGWAAFFYQLKLKQLNGDSARYSDPMNIDLRLFYNPNSGLNIVPADYVAKAMYEIYAQSDPGESYHLVNNAETPHGLYIPLMLKSLNITGPRLADRIPEDMNKFERYYYKTAGKVFTPYITSKPMIFDVSNLSGVLTKAKLRCPPVDEKNFNILMSYAKEKNFGVVPARQDSNIEKVNV
ncbi:MAG: SDR family oxidoreductase [Candidatus Omnitrophota bacterium]